jgi:hypothetical protein
MTLQSELESYLEEWRKKTPSLNGVPIEVQIGDLSELRRDQGVDEDHIGVTISPPDNKQFILAFEETAFEKMPSKMREHIVIHELMHANLSFSYGDDLTKQLEVLIDTLVEMMLKGKSTNASSSP